MARLLTESLVGDELVIPGTRDVFSVATAAMPNGDDCLQVTSSTGVLNGQGAFNIGVNPDSYLLNTASTDGYQSVSFWIKRQQALANFVSGTANANMRPAGSSFVMGVGSATSTNVSTDTATSIGTDASAPNWHLRHGSATGIDFAVVANGATGRFYWSAPTFDLTLNTWHLIVLDCPVEGGTVHVRAWRDALLASEYQIAGWGLSGRVLLSETSQFAIGDPSNRPAGGPQGAANGPLYQIGKLAFHAQRLSALQQLALYDSMFGV